MSVVANSGEVEVWLIRPDVLELIPPHVQEIVLNRLKKKKKTIHHNIKEQDKDIDEAMAKIMAAQ